MAMTKAEQKLLENALRARDMARSLRWPEYDQPRLMDTQEIVAEADTECLGRSKAFAGWTFNEHTMEVRRIWSNGAFHTFSDPSRQSGSWSQREGVVYRSKVDAARALRARLTEQFAGVLADIDKMIEEG